MIDLQSAQEFIRTLGSFASMISASVAVFNLRKKPDEPLSNEEKADILLARGRGAERAPFSQVALRVLLVIPDRYLHPIKNRLDQLDRDYQAILSANGTTVIEMKMTYEAIATQVCNLLDLIKRHNGGELASEDPFYLNRTTRHWHTQVAATQSDRAFGEAHCTNLMWTDLELATTFDCASRPSIFAGI